MTANVKGKIYYTRNGSTPTNKSKLYKDNEVLTICIKTQINAIVVTENNITSKITHYQSEQILTPPISVVVPQTDLINNQQTLNFTTNWDNTTIYYTTDGSNPKKSNTKIKYNNKTFKINKNTTLKYYTKDNLEGYESIVYTYNTPKYTQERPTLTIVNGKINQTIFFLLPDMNQLSDDDKDATPINTSFTSNYQNYTLNKKDKLNHLFTITEIMPFQTLQTYIITNRLINKDDIQQTINKNKTYTKNENKTFTNINEMEVDKTDHLKAAYGTYLTGETIIYFNDEMSKFYGSYNNVTFTRADDTQILVGVNHHGTIYSNIYDPTLSTKITNNPTVNQTVQFRFMTTVMMSEWEKQALRLSMQNITSPLYIFFEDVRLNNIM